MRLPRWIALVMAVMLVSGHTAGLQLVAWTGMAIERAQSRSIVDAVRSALDGTRPCRICTAVTALASDKPDAPAAAHPKPDLAPATAPLLLLPTIEPSALAVGDPARALRSWRADVPTPPPQGS